MIFTDKFLFLHYPKTGGMMLTDQFLNKLRGEVYYTVPTSHGDLKTELLSKIKSIKILNGIRHENYQQAKQFFIVNNLPYKIEKFEKILVLIRNPYDHAVSRFHYLKNNGRYNFGPAARLAMEGDFSKFVLKAPEFFKVNGYIFNEEGRVPDNMYVIRYEEMAIHLNSILKNYLKRDITFDKRVNASVRKNYREYIVTPKIEAAIYKKNNLLFDKGYYPRMKFD